MPRYFFDVREGDVDTPDREGSELTGRHLVAVEARKLLIEIARDLKRSDDRFEVAVSVREEDGQAIHWSSLLLKADWFAVKGS